MNYKIPQKSKKKDDLVKSVMFRIPVDLLESFNKALKQSNISAQLLVEDMVRHCLEESEK